MYLKHQFKLTNFNPLLPIPLFSQSYLNYQFTLVTFDDLHYSKHVIHLDFNSTNLSYLNLHLSFL